jgi:signal peptidase II
MQNDIKKKNTFLSVLVFTIMWLAYYSFELISGKISDKYQIIMSLLLPTLFFVILALMLNYFNGKKWIGFKLRNIFAAIIILTVLEQLIKFVIRNSLNSDSSIELINNWLYISPFLNSLGSWGASRFGLKLGINAFIVLNIIGIPLVIQGYRCYIDEKEKSFWMDMAFLLCLSGSLCSLIDKVFFGGSLDYLSVGNLFIADLKDFYITIALGCFFNEMLINNKQAFDTGTKDDIEVFRKFIEFNKKDILAVKTKASKLFL